MNTLAIKLSQLLLPLMTIITNRSFLTFSCVITDGVLKVLFTSGEWLNACVVAERMLVIIQGAQFNKKKEANEWLHGLSLCFLELSPMYMIPFIVI
jgi:hypothetical protein